MGVAEAYGDSDINPFSRSFASSSASTLLRSVGLLAHERSGLAAPSRSRAALTRLKAIARTELLDGEPLIRDPDFAHRDFELGDEILPLTDPQVVQKLGLAAFAHLRAGDLAFERAQVAPQVQVGEKVR